MQGYLPRLLALFAATMLAACSQTAVQRGVVWDEVLGDAVARPQLQKFSSEEEFDRYLLQLRTLAGEHNYRWAWQQRNPHAGLLAQESPCNPEIEDCEIQEITVSGSRIAQASITNNQEAGVDEGDIVKHYENFLIMLRHGRLFSVDLGDRPGNATLVDRVNLYRSEDDDVWFDELLISGNKLVVTGFNYGDDLTEISVYEISDQGVFTWLSTYEITSGDYYSSENYATRMVDEHLVIYTPMYLPDYDLEEGVIFPMFRRQSRDGEATFWQPLFQATDLYWPIQKTLQPSVHAVSICPISPDDAFECRSQGIIGPDYMEWYVSPEFAFVWLTHDQWELRHYGITVQRTCGPEYAGGDYEAMPSAVYRVPLFGGTTTAVRTAGHPPDQFSLDARDDELLALLAWEPLDCYVSWRDTGELRLARIDMREFSDYPGDPPPETFVRVPSSRGYYENRFSDNHVTYTDTEVTTMGSETEAEAYERSDLIVVPLDRPVRASRVPLGHTVMRLEVFGNGLVANGYLFDDGLYLSTISLDGLPGVVDTEYLFEFFESEGRSHAFNLRVDDDGSGMFGVPLTIRELHTYHQWSWMRRRPRSDIGFFEVDAAMHLSAAGMLLSSDTTTDEDYECTVSCEDWYGNARPIFLDGRIYALTGSELIEGRLASGQISEIARTSLTGTPAHSRP